MIIPGRDFITRAGVLVVQGTYQRRIGAYRELKRRGSEESSKLKVPGSREGKGLLSFVRMPVYGQVSALFFSDISKYKDYSRSC